jgi:hypothetical protein
LRKVIHESHPVPERDALPHDPVFFITFGHGSLALGGEAFYISKNFFEKIYSDLHTRQNDKREKCRGCLGSAVRRRHRLSVFKNLAPQVGQFHRPVQDFVKSLLIHLFACVFFNKGHQVVKLIDHVINISLKGFLIGTAYPLGNIKHKKRDVHFIGHDLKPLPVRIADGICANHDIGLADPSERLFDFGVVSADVCLAVGTQIPREPHALGMLNQALRLFAGGGHGRHIFRMIRENIIDPHEFYRESGAGPSRLFPGQRPV